MDLNMCKNVKKAKVWSTMIFFIVHEAQTIRAGAASAGGDGARTSL